MGTVKNTVNPNKFNIDNIPKNLIETHSYTNNKLIIDFSFAGSFVSCECGEFNNYLTDGNEYIIKFRKIMKDVENLSDNTLCKLINSDEHSHCHKVAKEDEKRALNIIKKTFKKIGKNESYFQQEVGGEGIVQLGLQSEVRLFGTVKGNIFRVYFTDYFHDFEFDGRRNTRNKKNCKFCVINTKI